jgi:type IV fimbrial biogenesis protein FimT
MGWPKNTRSGVNSLESGVTLVELIVVMTIAGILLAIGVPSYKYVTSSNRVTNEINGLLGDMQFARYEAVKEGLNVKVCPVDAFTPPSPPPTTCNASTTWNTGWIVLSNAASPNGAVVLRRQLPFANVNSNDTLTNNPATAEIEFNREGFAVNLTQPVVFSLYGPGAISTYTRCLIVGVSGVLLTAQPGTTILGTCS